MKHTKTLNRHAAKFFSLMAILSMFVLHSIPSSAQFLCSAGFQYSVSGTTVMFWDSSFSSSGGGYTTQWSFGNGTGSSQPNPVVQYNSTGYYYVCLTIVDSLNGCTNTFCDTINVGIPSGNCTANFSYTISGNTVTFIDASSAGTVAWAWDFGDNSTGIGSAVTHTYTGSGYYQVCLFTSDSNGCTAMHCEWISINGGSSGCNASFSAANNSGLTVAFSNTSTGGGFFTSYYWNFDDGTTSNLNSPTHTYTTPGVYYVCLTMMDSSISCYSTFCDTVIITSAAGCYASFSYNISGNTVAFTNTSTGNFTNASWSFGDGSGGTGLANVTHTYGGSGVYFVCLTISNNNGTCQDTYCDTVYIGGVINSYAISGFISGNNNFMDYAEVYLIQYDSVTQSLNLIDTYEIVPGDSAYYIFTNQGAGSYLVKAAADTGATDYATLVPTYYNNSLFWSTASYVTLGPSQWSVNINLVQGMNPGGPGFIGGLVSQGANKLEAEGDPLSGIQILLLDMSNIAVANTYSDASGNYSFGNLAYGTYKVYAEILNKITYPAIITIDANNPSITSVPVIVNTNSVTTGIKNNLSENLTNAVLFPNPAVDFTTLSLNAVSAGNCVISVYELSGRKLYSVNEKILAGENLISLNLKNLDCGLYMVKIDLADQAYNIKLSVLK